MNFAIADRHLFAVLEGAGLGVWLHEPATGRVLWSDFLCRLLGYAKGEAPTSLVAWMALVHPADRPAVQAAVTAVAAAAASAPPALEIRIRSQNGAWSAVCLRRSPLTSGSGEACAHTLGTLTPISHSTSADGDAGQDAEPRYRVAEQALRNELQLTCEIINSAPGLFYLLDESGHFLRWNRNLETVSGYAGDAISRMEARAFFEPDSQARVSQAIEETFAKGKSSLEASLLTRNGRTIPHFFTGRSVMLNDQPCLIGFGVDITEQKQRAAELDLHRKHLLNMVEERTRQLQHSEARMRSILQASPLGIGVVVDRQLCEVNDAMSTITGYSVEEMIGHSARLLYPSEAEFRRVGEERYAQMTAEGRGVIETVWRQKTGALRHVLLASALIDPGNPALGCSFTAFDITERKLIEQALAANEKFLRTFTDALPSMVSHWDAGLRCRFANRAYLEWFGKTPEQMQGMPIRELLGEELFRLNQAHIEAVLRGEHRQFERSLKKPSGEMGHLLIEYIPERAGEEIMGFYVMVTDVTLVKHAEAKLAESQQALRQMLVRQDQIRESERKHLARELHDELGQLLTGMHFMVSALQLTADMTTRQVNKIGLELATYLDQTQAVVRRITRDLHPAQLEHGLLPALEVLATEFCRRSGIACRLTLSGPDPELDATQSTSIFRIVQESLTNVARHAQASSVAVHIESTTGCLNLKITDDGQGFDLAALASDGQSFGLISMQERTAQLGAMLKINAAPGQGTTIAVNLPIKRKITT